MVTDTSDIKVNPGKLINSLCIISCSLCRAFMEVDATGQVFSSHQELYHFNSIKSNHLLIQLRSGQFAWFHSCVDLQIRLLNPGSFPDCNRARKVRVRLNPHDTVSALHFLDRRLWLTLHLPYHYTPGEALSSPEWVHQPWHVWHDYPPCHTFPNEPLICSQLYFPFPTDIHYFVISTLLCNYFTRELWTCDFSCCMSACACDEEMWCIILVTHTIYIWLKEWMVSWHGLVQISSQIGISLTSIPTACPTPQACMATQGYWIPTACPTP